MRYLALARAAVLLIVAASLSAPAHAGPLDPPAGPVAPTHKTLTQIEPRIPISAATTPGDSNAAFIINQPGSYYLTGDLIGEAGKHGIVIVATGPVAIDLGGFTFGGTAGAQTGIIAGITTPFFSVRNGSLVNWPGGAIHTFLRVVVSDVYVSGGGGGSSGYVINTGSDGRVERCTLEDVAQNGINATCISDCTVAGPGSGIGINCNGGLVTRCVARGFGTSGIRVSGAAASDCRVLGCTTGITAERSLVSGCHVSLCISGFFTFSPPQAGSTLTRCTASGSTIDGFTTDHADTLIDCTALDSGGRGFLFQGGTLTRCTASGCGSAGFSTLATNPPGMAPRLDSCTARANTGAGFILNQRGAAAVNCTAVGNGAGGIQTNARGVRLTGCVVEGNTGAGIASNTPDDISNLSIDHCTVRANTGVGIVSEATTTVTDSTIAANAAGLSLTSSATVRGCTVTSNAGSGIEVSTASVVSGNTVVSNTAAAIPGTAGILVTGTDSAVESNRVYTNPQGGIRIDAAGNFVVRNILARTGATITAVPGNSVAQIITSPAAGFVSTDPNANYIY